MLPIRCLINRISYVTALFLSVTAAIVSGQAQQDIYKVGGDVTAPVVVRKVAPKWTKAAKKRRIWGTVMLSGVVTKEGTTSDLQVIKGIDDGLDAEAVKAVFAWRFKPAEKAGVPVAVMVQFEVNFRLCPRWETCDTRLPSTPSFKSPA